MEIFYFVTMKMKILALQHSIDVRHRKLECGLEYIPPPEKRIDIFNISEKILRIKTTHLAGKMVRTYTWFAKKICRRNF